MPSPFPGMDPFIESQEWGDFHHQMISVIQERLTPNVAPRYVVRVQWRVYVEHLSEDPRFIIPDVSLPLRDDQLALTAEAAFAPENAVAVAPVECLLPMPEERREAFLEIRERQSRRVVTVVELLSPSNKRASSNGFDTYLRKREKILESRTHLVELDLLRGGRRPPVSRRPPGDYFAVLSRATRRPTAEVYAWRLRQPLPPIGVPLMDEDGDVTLDLQQAFVTVFDRVRFDLSLDYAGRPVPSLSESDDQWVRSTLESFRSPS